MEGDGVEGSRLGRGGDRTMHGGAECCRDTTVGLHLRQGCWSDADDEVGCLKQSCAFDSFFWTREGWKDHLEKHAMPRWQSDVAIERAIGKTRAAITVPGIICLSTLDHPRIRPVSGVFKLGK